jgi:hypothetical protein
LARHLEGWPGNWRQQLAQALEVPRRDIPTVHGLGGPLAMALAMGTTVGFAVERWFAEALEDSMPAPAPLTPVAGAARGGNYRNAGC